MKSKYPFDPSLKHHIIVGFGLGLWIFLFLFITEPLDISELNPSEKLKYLPFYSLIATFSYVLFLPIQYYIYRQSNNNWFLKHEVLFLLSLSIVSITLARLYYLYIVVAGQANPHTLGYMLKALLLPALAIILPIIVIGRFAFGKYFEKKLEDKKIEIKGEGNYESLKLHLNELIAVQSSDNYIEIFYLSGTNLKKSLIRNKLSYIETTFSELQRTHRSYIINPYHFQSWKTEKGKHFLMLSHNIQIPISKTYLEAVKSTFNFATAG
ncbi:LytTR family DNA-binding domain-containing protein [Olleya marilimosa]|uniref:LytTR family DNA-binding domain-containing protein n=1 Tax=Olleya marilimosa TaxID=272164 RepID=UPI00048743CB|nr:LytTR family DNA-binding domain-containing protein [Olleya marilimosa]